MTDVKPDKAKFFLDESFLNGDRMEISQERFEDYLLARNAISSLYKVENLFSLCAMSFIELESLLAVASIEYMAGEYDGEEFTGRSGILRDKLNLKIVALLTTFRAYKDQCGQRLKGVNAFSADAAPNMKAEFSKVFDASLEHRIMEGLRNYAQHADLPLYGTTYSHANQWRNDNPHADEPSRHRITINPYFSAKELINSEIRKSTRDDISSLNLGKLDAKILIRKYVADFAECHTVLKNSTEWIVDHAGAYIEDAYVTFSRIKGSEAKFIELQKECADGEVESFHLRRENPVEVKKLRARWGALTRSVRAFVSSEPVFEKDTYLGSDTSLWVPK